MIYGIGTDIVRVARMRTALGRFGDRFARRLLTDIEWAEFEITTRKENLLAKRFAVKEAAVKALGTGFGQGVFWHDVGTEHDRYGRPRLWRNPAAQQRFERLGITDAFVSVADEDEYAVAFVILVR